MEKINRNDPCWCGSGKKYKKCHLPIEEKMMYNTFNMGLGMIIAVDKADVEKTMAAIKEAGEECYVVGSVEAGEKVAELC